MPLGLLILVIVFLLAGAYTSAGAGWDIGRQNAVDRGEEKPHETHVPQAYNVFYLFLGTGVAILVILFAMSGGR